MRIALVIPAREPHTEDDHAFELLTLRYKIAYAEYRELASRNSEHNLTCGKLSENAQLEEERAFDELDSARYALLAAAAESYPTIH